MALTAALLGCAATPPVPKAAPTGEIKGTAWAHTPQSLAASVQNANVVHQEFRDDRYVAAMNVDPYGVTHLLYLARAVTPGTYRVPPVQVESMYRPNWQAVGESPGDMVILGR